MQIYQRQSSCLPVTMTLMNAFTHCWHFWFFFLGSSWSSRDWWWTWYPWPAWWPWPSRASYPHRTRWAQQGEFYTSFSRKWSVRPDLHSAAFAFSLLWGTWNTVPLFQPWGTVASGSASSAKNWDELSIRSIRKNVVFTMDFRKAKVPKSSSVPSTWRKPKGSGQ